MKLFPRLVTSATIATTAVIGISSTTYASTLEFDLLFETSNQSIWDTGNAFSFTDDRFLGVDWDESVSEGFSIPGFCVIPNPFGDCILGFDGQDIGFSAFTNGEIGLQSTFNLNGGTVNAFIPVDLFLVIPDEPVKKGETFTIQSGFSFANGATFKTFSPDASYNLDFIFDVAAGIDVDPGFDLGFDVDKTINLVNFDTGDLSFNKTGNLGSLEVSFPKVDTMGNQSGSNQLTSSGEDEFVNGTLDLDFIATSLFGLPPLEGGESIDLPVVDDLGFSYNLLDVEATAVLSALQAFSLTGTLPALLSLEDGTTIPFNIGEDIAITMPSNAGKFLDINAFVDFNALFNNTTSLGLDLGLDALIGEFDLELPVLPDISVEPLFEESVDIFDTSFEVYNNTFNLAGFNQEQISFQVETVPEPTSLLGLLSFGVLGAGSALKRKRDQQKLIKRHEVEAA
ncbi:PEP-CTERM sorting domain-containing protein [Coleofasciculus sp. G2-EDA-02]|uniref:PEP-CTERM sorting domain-containing protein n=1 Tax=Coleofasciculus sp. G2-EDA-02 TaxID=3069529 RepID=UPI0032F1C26B